MSAVATPAASPAEVTEHWVGPMMVLVVGMFMTVLDTSIVNVAIPTIQTDFGGSTADLAWISTAYSLVLGVVVPLTAWVGDKVGLARVYTFSLAGFALVKLCWPTFLSLLEVVTTVLDSLTVLAAMGVICAAPTAGAPFTKS